MPDLQTAFQRKDATILEKECQYSGFFRIDRYQVEHARFDGSRLEVIRDVFERGEAAAVILFDPEQDTVVLTEQFRAGALNDSSNATPWLYEVVAGMIEEGETPESVAVRESEEEAGCTPDQLIPVSSFWTSPGGTSEKIHLFCALIDSRGLGGLHGLEEEQEDIRSHVVPCDVAFENVKNGTINNATTIIALQWLMLNRDSLR